MKEFPTVIDGAEVFDSEGTLALTVNGYDMLYLKVVHPDEFDSEARPKLTDEQHQKIIDTIVAALGVVKMKHFQIKRWDDPDEPGVIVQAENPRKAVSKLLYTIAPEKGIVRDEEELFGGKATIVQIQNGLWLRVVELNPEHR